MISRPGKESIVNFQQWRFLQEMSTSTPARMSPALQQAFLNCSHYFVTEGGSSTTSPMLIFCFFKAWLNSVRACNPASPPTSLYLSTQGWPSPNLRPTWCRWPTLVWILESSIHFGPIWVSSGIRSNEDSMKLSTILWYFLMEHWRCRILISDFFFRTRNIYKCCTLLSCLTLWEATRVASSVIPLSVLFLTRMRTIWRPKRGYYQSTTANNDQSYIMII